MEKNPAKNALWVGFSLALLAGIALSVLTYGGEQRWIGHAAISLMGLGLIFLVLINGATLSGRLKRGGEMNVFRLHRSLSVLFSVFMFFSFFYGLWVTWQHGEALLSSIHGWLGLVIVILSVLQVVPCLVPKRRLRIRSLHMIVGYALAFLVVVQAAWGLEIAVVGEVSNVVMLHSTLGAVEAFAFAWIIVEMRHLTERGIARSKVASYVGAFLNIVGCWVAGGYYYLTVYGSQVKPAILSGVQPWAHRIVMETKEHVFLFLPVVSLTLVFVLIFLGKNQALLADAKGRKAVTAIAGVALFMVLLMFIFGVLISNAARIGLGGE